jgi:hypothetical protein
MAIHLTLDARKDNPLNEIPLRQEEEDDNGRDDHDGRGHKQMPARGPIGRVAQ